jgi:CheY-like chemotaxis protein
MPDDILVLLVEDDRDTREMYVLGLELHGMTVLEADTGAAAIASASSRVPQVIVTDLSLPDMDGIELCQRLTSDARTRDIPLLALTGSSHTEDLERLASVGARQVIVKPCPPDDLARAIAGVLGG